MTAPVFGTSRSHRKYYTSENTEVHKAHKSYVTFTYTDHHDHKCNQTEMAPQRITRADAQLKSFRLSGFVAVS